MTPAEITILRSLAEADVVTFMPDGHTPAALARFQATLESLREMQKAGWWRSNWRTTGSGAGAAPAGRGRVRRLGARRPVGRPYGCWASESYGHYAY
ncbi:MAG: hypothetical protein ACJ8DC_19090, partial [Gemmatimonadales bacterium]